MVAKRYQNRPVEAPDYQHFDDHPIDRPVAVYYRQSTGGQIGNESTAMQREDLPDQLARMGWHPDLIIKINSDEAVSGTLDIIERPGMTALIDLIQADKIGAVAAVAENRLFRDQYADQSALFVRACAEHKVTVIIPGHMTYVFHNPRMGEWHQEMFLRSAREGWSFIEYHIRGRMLGARDRRAMRGLWIGGSIPPGFMVDLDTSKFVPFEPAAEVIRAWYELLLSFRGNLMRTWRHIRDHGPYLPDFEVERTKLERNPDGSPKYLLKKPNTMKKRDGLYCYGRAAFTSVFTNVAYIGAWAVKGDVLRDENGEIKRNHPAIVDDNTFWTAFNYLSAYDLDGNPNPDYAPAPSTRPKHPDLAARVGVPLPFLENILNSPDLDGKLQRCCFQWHKKTGSYEYTSSGYNAVTVRLWTKSANAIDSVVHDFLAQLTVRDPRIVDELTDCQ